MNDHPDKQQELQKMLALKRHEIPPPRFFRSFSERVLDRLNTPEPPPPRTLRHRLGLGADPKPVMVCLSGVAVCALLVVGLLASLRMEPARPAPPPPDDQTYLILAPSPTAQPGVVDGVVPINFTGPQPSLAGPVMDSSSPMTVRSSNLAQHAFGTKEAPPPPAPQPPPK
jgi:hypothetical protein